MKIIATLLLGIALCCADTLSAQAGSAPASKKTDSNSPAALSWKKDKCTAKKLLKKGKTAAAIPYLEAGLQKKPKKKYFLEKLAPAYLEVRNYSFSNKCYKVLAYNDSIKHKTTANLFKYALTQKYLGEYEQSIDNFTRYRKTAGDNELAVELKKRANREIQGSQKGIYFRDSVPRPAFRAQVLDANVNQPAADYAPRLRDNALYFSSQRDGNPLSRIYRSAPNGKAWGAAEAISDNINAPGLNIGNGSFSADGNTLYYSECHADVRNKQKCSIYRSKYTNGAWEKGAPLGININDPLFNNTQPAVGLNKDGEDVLYFVSDRNPLKGLDIYAAKINADGSLGKAHSLGSQINSKGDEVSPYFDFKTKTLYFSSNGWVSIGGQDVFKSTWDANGEWTEPENLGTPINSSADDAGFYINAQNTLGFVVSNRPGGAGLESATCCDDIYQIETTKLFLAARGNVYEEKGNVKALADNGIVLLYDENTGSELAAYNLISGGYFFDLQPKVSYKVVTRKDGFYDGVSSFTTNDNTTSDTLTYDLLLKKKNERAALLGHVIGRVYYDLDQPRLRADSRDSLIAVLGIMDQNPSLIVEVGGHTDTVGPLEYNIELSQERAAEVMNYLIHNKKVNSDRLTVKAYGPSQPLAPNYTADGKNNAAGQALNRRTEFKVIGELKLEQIDTNAAISAASDKPANVIRKDLGFSKPAASSQPAPATPPVSNAASAPASSPATAPASVPATAPASAPADVSTSSPATAPAAVPTSTPATVPATSPATNADMGQVTTPAAKPDDKKLTQATDTGAAQPLVVTGKVYIDQDGSRTLVKNAGVFLTSNEGGFTQKFYYVGEDSRYRFDLSHSAADTFRLVARKYTFESDEVIFTGADIRKSNPPIDLVIKAK